MASRAAALTQPDARAFEGADKVAALLLAMGKPAAGRLLKHFDAAELKEITRAAADLGPIAPTDLELLIEEFAGEFAAGVSLLGTAQEVEKLLTGILPAEQIAAIMTDVLGGENGSVWEKASETPEGPLVELLSQEHPQTAAFILSKVNTACAARVISQMAEAPRNALMRRLATINPVNDMAARLAEGSLDAALAGLASKSGNEVNVRMADILNRMEHKHIDDILDDLAQARPDTAKAVKSLLFRFEDIDKLTAKARTALFDGIPAERVVLALKGTGAEFRELVLSAIASRARRMVESELDNGDEPNPRAVAEARRMISDRVLELAGRGEIELNASENGSG